MNNHSFTDLSTYSEQLNNCPVCGTFNIQKKFIITKYKPHFKIDQCNECDFIFMNPQFNDEIINKFYDKDYYKGNSEYSYYDEREAEEYSLYVWEKRIRKIRTYAGSGNILDIGCAFGGFLKAASKWFTPFGIELSEYSCEHAKKLYNDNIHSGTLNDNPFQKNVFSVITMIEVIEHLKEPLRTLVECYNLLKTDGLLVIQTANMDALQAKFFGDKYGYYMPGHLSYFTKKNLTTMLNDIGFKKIKVYQPVEFGLMPKLLKSRYSFNRKLDYMKWFRITFYHYISKIRFRNFSTTCSMVIYATK